MPNVASAAPGGAEGGVSGAGGALANAVADALAPFRPQVTTLPLAVDRVLAMVCEPQPAHSAAGRPVSK